MFALKDCAMDDQYQPFGSDWTRQYYDPSHPLYVRTGYDDASDRPANSGPKTELGPWGTRLIYAAFLLVFAYFALIFVFGAH